MAERKRLMTHIGFGGHYQLQDHIGHVQVDDEDDSVDSDLTNELSETSISDKVADFETARKIEETIARFPEAKKRADKSYVSKRSFTAQKGESAPPSAAFSRNNNFALALSSVLKLCVEEVTPEVINDAQAQGVAHHPAQSAAQHLQAASAGVEATGLPSIALPMDPAPDLAIALEKLKHTTIRAKFDDKHGRVKLRNIDVDSILSQKDMGLKPSRPTTPASNRRLSSSKARRISTADTYSKAGKPEKQSVTSQSLCKRTTVTFADIIIQEGNGKPESEKVIDQCDEDDSYNDPNCTSRAEEENVTASRHRIKELGNKLKSFKDENKTLTPAIKEELNVQHENMSDVMMTLLEQSCNRLSDEKRLNLEESVLVMNGFNALDCDSDGLLSHADFKNFFKKRGCKTQQGSIDRILWLLDDNRRGHLALQDVQKYYFRVISMFQHWTPIVELEKHYAIVQSNPSVINAMHYIQRPSSASPRKMKMMLIDRSSDLKTKEEKDHHNNLLEDNPRYSLAVLRNAMESFNESLLLFRLVLFAALENRERKVHVLSALEQMVERFGPEIADRKFEQLFCKSAVNLQDSEMFTLSKLLGHAYRWDKKFEPFKVPLTPRDKADIYIQYRNTDLERKIKAKLEEDELDAFLVG